MCTAAKFPSRFARKTAFRSLVSALLLLHLLIADPLAANETLDVDPTKPQNLLLHVCSVDGTPIRPLVAETQLRHLLNRQGTPDVSADGKRVAFDAWSSNGTFNWQDSRIIIVDIDGQNANDISDGVMPSFSPDADRLVVSRPPKHAKSDGATGMSIWIMDVDGQNKRLVADHGAWGGRWSPDGRSIVFYGGQDEDGNKVASSCLRLYDVDSEKITTVFTDQESPFTKLSFHFDWNKSGGRWVVFGGPLKDGGSGTAIIDVDQGIDSLKMLESVDGGPSVLHGLSYDWHPNGKQILMTGVVKGRPLPVSIATSDEKPQQSFDAVPESVIARDPVYTPDGQHIIVSLGAP